MIPLFRVFMHEDAVEASVKVLRSGYIGQGPVVEQFEKELSNYLDDNVVTTNSATSAAHLAFHMTKNYDTQYRDEVLCTALTCTATNWPVLANGLKIKWVDIDPNTLNMDIDDLARKITNKTLAINIVHWGGYPIDYKKMYEALDKTDDAVYNYPSVIEDCAHAFGSTYEGSPLSNQGGYCIYSFQAIKHLTCGDGGALVLPHLSHVENAKLLRWYGIDRNTNSKDFRCEADIREWGFKFHMNDISASIGLANLKHIQKEVIDKHKDNAAYYYEKLQDIDGITLLERKENRESAYWIFSLLVDRKADFMKHMAECNIMVSQVHERNDIHSCVLQYKSALPNLDATIDKVISIPVGWWVTKEDREYIVDCIKKGW
jgi:dTDP-4-amino-4,6-dideoxygalactose transaminase